MAGYGRSSRRGFTLTELIVAIGVVGLLTVAIGQIFGSVSRLVSVGTALAEVDGLARHMEARLQEDFDALNRIGAQNTYIAIRWREVGDLDRDRTADLSANEEEVYLTPDDEEADRKDRFARPYETQTIPSSGRTIASRAITTRIDEIAFLGMSPPDAPFRSAQVQGDAEGARSPSARAARIYWGHALKPRPQRSNVTPEREFVPDGDFGWGPRAYDGTVRSYATPLDDINGQNIPVDTFAPSGRNKFAGDWTLARQTLLLYGGGATGAMDPLSGVTDAPIGRDREYAPYVSDIVSASRFSPGNVLAGLQSVRPGLGPNVGFQTPGLGDNRVISDPRPIGGGRVDICAQDEIDVRSMVEGESPADTQTSPSPYTGQPYRSGWLGSPPIHFDDPAQASLSSEPFVRPLWKRADPQNQAIPGLPWSPPPFVEPVTYENNVLSRSLLAGTLQRLLVDTGSRGRARVWPTAAGQPAPSPPIDAPEDALMDLHAAFAPRCSRFEVAWSDGSTVIDPNGVDLNSDGQPDLLAGEIVWFDFSPVLRNDGRPVVGAGRALRRSYFDLYFLLGANGGVAFRSGDPSLVVTAPEIMPDVTSGFSGSARLLQNTQIDPLFPMAYHRSVTGGAPDPEHEAFAIWGFREPTGDGNWGRAWPKPRFIRIRATLHDAQFRLPGGKTFEWVFEIGAGDRL